MHIASSGTAHQQEEERRDTERSLMRRSFPIHFPHRRDAASRPGPKFRRYGQNPSGNNRQDGGIAGRHGYLRPSLHSTLIPPGDSFGAVRGQYTVVYTVHTVLYCTIM